MKTVYVRVSHANSMTTTYYDLFVGKVDQISINSSSVGYIGSGGQISVAATLNKSYQLLHKKDEITRIISKKGPIIHTALLFIGDLHIARRACRNIYL